MQSALGRSTKGQIDKLPVLYCCLRRENQRNGWHADAHDRHGSGEGQDRDEEPGSHHAPPEPVPGLTLGRGNQAMRHETPRVIGATQETTWRLRTRTRGIIPVSSRPARYSRPESLKIEVP